MRVEKNRYTQKKNDGHDNGFTRRLGVLRKLSFGFISAIRLITHFSIMIELYVISFKCKRNARRGLGRLLYVFSSLLFYSEL